jgi:formylglycine-generating enzyme required for sulfatase activity
MPSRVLVVLSAMALVLFAVPAATQPTRGSAPAGPGGGSFRDCPHCPEMVAVAAGSFLMGDEHPPRRVTLEYRFAYSKDKVSFRDWKHCVLGGQCQSLGATGTASLDPVVQVSWVDVQQYLSWLSLETGVEYRLLSEAEWEYLARSPATRSPGLGAGGLEWTSDCWHGSYAGAPTDGSSWDADGDCRYHVARGRRPGEAAPSVTKRYRFLFDARDAALGFRVARTMRE